MSGRFPNILEGSIRPPRCLGAKVPHWSNRKGRGELESNKDSFPPLAELGRDSSSPSLADLGGFATYKMMGVGARQGIPSHSPCPLLGRTSPDAHKS
jgi:hypothetical protein